MDLRGVKEFFKDSIVTLLIITVTVFVTLSLFSLVRVVGTSMEPNVHDRDILLINKIKYKISAVDRGDIVLVRTEEGIPLIKRVIGLPGETVSFIDNMLLINGEVVEENYLNVITEDFEEIEVEEGRYFLMGDNRSVSEDSRFYGSFKKDRIIGKLLFNFSSIFKNDK